MNLSNNVDKLLISVSYKIVASYVISIMKSATSLFNCCSALSFSPVLNASGEE